MSPRGWKIIVFLSTLTILQPPKCDGKLTGFTERGTVSAVFQTQGHRNHMEDTFIRIENASGTGIGVYAVFDGHGGDHSSNFSRDYFTQKIGNELDLFGRNRCSYVERSNGRIDFKRMLKVFIAKAENHLKDQITNRKLHRSGTTCLIAIVEKDRLTVANVGDSRGVMCSERDNVIDLSVDHKPNSESERKRIEDAGGRVYMEGVWRVNGLAMSRSLGDHDRKRNESFIIAKADIETFNIDADKPKFMILATDGLWDVMSSQEAVDFIKMRYFDGNDFGALALAYEAVRLGSKDNITVLIVVFKNGRFEVGSAST